MSWAPIGIDDEDDYADDDDDDCSSNDNNDDHDDDNIDANDHAAGDMKIRMKISLR